MSKRATVLTLAALSALAAGPTSAQQLIFRDPNQPVERRVADLLGRMTLEEKVAQTLALWKGKEQITDEEGAFAPDKAAQVISHGLGQLARPTELRDKPRKILLGGRENARFVNAEYDDLYRQSKRIPDGPERTALYRKMASIIAAYTPWDMGVYRYENTLVRPWLLGYKKNVYNEHPWLYLDVDVSKRNVK